MNAPSEGRADIRKNPSHLLLGVHERKQKACLCLRFQFLKALPEKFQLSNVQTIKSHDERWIDFGDLDTHDCVAMEAGCVRLVVDGGTERKKIYMIEIFCSVDGRRGERGGTGKASKKLLTCLEYERFMGGTSWVECGSKYNSLLPSVPTKYREERGFPPTHPRHCGSSNSFRSGGI